jgi:hypothetical protein
MLSPAWLRGRFSRQVMYWRPDPETLGNDALEGDLYPLGDRLRDEE